jgi:hypothetical protein
VNPSRDPFPANGSQRRIPVTIVTNYSLVRNGERNLVRSGEFNRGLTLLWDLVHSARYFETGVRIKDATSKRFPSENCPRTGGTPAYFL